MNINIKKISTSPFIFMVKVYKVMLSPYLGNNCRFTPSCSSYMIEALQQHGVLRGLFLGTKRLAKCHPWGGSGHDPVLKKKIK